MGKVKYLKTVENLFRKSPVVSTRDVKTFVKKNYSYLLIHNLMKAGRIKRITKGFYSIYEDPIILVFCFKPAYIGLQEALSFHNLWEQETATVVITSRRVRAGIRKVFGTNVIVRRIKPSYLFGFVLVKYENFFVPVSDIEKTLIDFVYFNEAIDKKVLRKIKRRIDRNKLKAYLKNYPETLRRKVERLMS